MFPEVLVPVIAILLLQSSLISQLLDCWYGGNNVLVAVIRQIGWKEIEVYHWTLTLLVTSEWYDSTLISSGVSHVLYPLLFWMTFSRPVKSNRCPSSRIKNAPGNQVGWVSIYLFKLRRSSSPCYHILHENGTDISKQDLSFATKFCLWRLDQKQYVSYQLPARSRWIRKWFFQILDANYIMKKTRHRILLLPSSLEG